MNIRSLLIAGALAASATTQESTNRDLPSRDLVVRGNLVHTAEGPPIENGVVVVTGGIITAIGPAGSVEVPTGWPVVEAAVVTPGLIDAHSVVGLAGYLNTPHDQEQLERSEPVQPELRAIDAYDPREPLVAWLRDFGITTVHTGHAPGAVISGQTLIAKTVGDTVEEAVLRPFAMVACTLGDAAEPPEGSPGTRAKASALLRAELQRAREYAAARERAAADGDAAPVPRDLRLEALLPVLAGDVPLLVHADRSRDLQTALRIGLEFGVRVVLDGAAEAHLITEEIAAAGVPVLLHAPMRRPRGDGRHMSFESAARLTAAGIPTALQSGYEGYVPKTRVVLFEAAIAAANGLGPDGALRAITIDAARILGVADRVGSLSVGKDGDLALFDGDPFEYTTHCLTTIVEGRVVSDVAR